MEGGEPPGVENEYSVCGQYDPYAWGMINSGLQD